MVGSDALSETDQSYLRFSTALERSMLHQRRDEMRDLDDTLDRAWEALSKLPRRELTMLSRELIDEHLNKKGGLG
jgi:V/A-type H+-transporting ATPase subunit B